MGSFGFIYLLSMLFSMVVFATVYTLAKHPFAPRAELQRGVLSRFARLGGVLGGLMIVVHFLSH